MTPIIVDTTSPTQDGLLASFDSQGNAIAQDFVFRDVLWAFYHRPVVPNVSALRPWDDDWLNTDTFQLGIGPRNSIPTGGAFPIGVFAGTITGNTNANPTVITTSAAHNLNTNDLVLITGSNSTPSIDGLYTFTKISSTTGSIPVNVSVAGTAGSVYDATGLSALNYNVADSAFQSALTTITSKHGYPNVTVALQSTGEYLMTGTTVGAIPSLYSPSDNTLTPASGVSIAVISDGSSSTTAKQIVSLYQSLVAYSTPSTALPVAAISMSTPQAGGASQNKIRAIALTAGTYGGTMSVSVTIIGSHSGTYGFIANGGVTADQFQTALINATGLTTTDFNVTRVNDVINIEFAGTQKNSASPTLTATNVDLLAPLGVSGTLNLNTFALYQQFAETTGNELTFSMAIRRTRATGEQSEYYIQDVTLKRNLIQGVSLIPVPSISYFTSDQSDARYLRSSANSNLTSGNTLTANSGSFVALSAGATLGLFGTNVTDKTGTGKAVLDTSPSMSGASIRQASTVYTADGALAIGSGISFIEKSSAAAMTIAAPSQDDIRMTIMSNTDFAHVVTFTGATLLDGVSVNTTATFNPFKGASMTVVSRGSFWLVESLNHVACT